MRRTRIAAFTATALLACGVAAAGKVNIPKEGSYEFELCKVGHGRTLSNSDKVFAISYDMDAVLRTTPPGGPFDRVGARLWPVDEPQRQVC